MPFISRLPNRTDMLYDAFVNALKAYFGLSKNIPDILRWNGNYTTGREYIQYPRISDVPHITEEEDIDPDEDVGIPAGEASTRLHIAESFPSSEDIIGGR